MKVFNQKLTPPKISSSQFDIRYIETETDASQIRSQKTDASQIRSQKIETSKIRSQKIDTSTEHEVFVRARTPIGPKRPTQVHHL